MMVCTYDEVLADPPGWCERLVAFLGELGARRLAVNPAVATFAVDGMRNSHESWSELGTGPLSVAQAALAKVASTPVTAASFMPPTLPPESPGTETIFAEVRRHLAGPGNTRHRVRDLPPHLASRARRRAGAGQTRPPVSVVLAQRGADLGASTAALAVTLPTGSELLFIGGAQPAGDDWRGARKLLSRTIDCAQPPTHVEALALGAAAARGTIVLLTVTRLMRCDRWYEAFNDALAPDGVGGVGPVMRFGSDPARRWSGTGFTDPDLSLGLRADSAAAPAHAASLFAAFSAFDRRVLVAAGGLDAQFHSTSTAVAELCIRLWRMGFHCDTIPQVEVWSDEVNAADDFERAAENDSERLYDRMRIAMLHFGPARLRSFTEHASRLPSFETAAALLKASDVEHRRDAIAAVCAFPVDRYFERFPPRAAERRLSRRLNSRVRAFTV